ncbi:MAG: phosphatidate cytidylyltransferase [Bryobacteraceae bacterium]
MSIPQDGWWVLGGLFAALVIGSVVGFVLHLLAPGSTAVENINARIKGWWAIIVLVGGAGVVGSGAVIILFGFISLFALREFITVTRTGRADHAALFASFFLVIPAQYALIWADWYGLFTIFIPVYAFLILPILAMRSEDSKNFLTRTAETQWGLLISVYCVSYVPALLTLRIPQYEGRSILLLAFLIIVVQSSDILQFICGKLFGRHLIAPAVSPSKTVEGFVGGVLLATLLGAAMWRITPFNPLQAAGMSLVITLMGFLGGLVMSAIKRDRQVKDWGRLVEGHGGVLDRLDSICVSAPIFFHLTRYLFVP